MADEGGMFLRNIDANDATVVRNAMWAIRAVETHITTDVKGWAASTCVTYSSG
jgi:hypothetical protein